jgi:hypothetical protein
MIKYTIPVLISLAIIVLLSCKENTKTSLVSNEDVSSSVIDTLNQNKWIGNYNLDLLGKGDLEGEEYKIGLNISKDSVIYYAEGYQLYQRFLLNPIEENNTLHLQYKQSLDGTKSWALRKTLDFGKIYLKNGKYVWESPFLNTCFTNNQKIIYNLSNNKATTKLVDINFFDKKHHTTYSLDTNNQIPTKSFYEKKVGYFNIYYLGNTTVLV